LAGYGIADAAIGRDDYAGVKVKDRIVLVRRFVPEKDDRFSATEAQRRFGDLRYKAWVAREHGAKGLVVVDWPEASPPPAEARLPSVEPEATDVGIPVVVVKRAAVEAAMALLTAKRPVPARLSLALQLERRPTFNVVGRIAAGVKDKLPGVI